MGNLQSSPSSSNTTLEKKYDVFLSFRGEDTRDCFTSHLYEALRRKQIETFIDYRLIRGDEISPSLMKAIKESKISVVIFSKDYATSKWCLRELIEILKCKKTNKQIVIPIFYRVDPSVVRKQTGSFKDSFVKHEKELQEEVITWRQALAEASDISGWHSSDGRTDSTLVNEIVNDIWKKLMSVYISPDFGGLIGLEPRIEQIMSSLCLHVTTDVRIIGIWGMGGIGKTTLADAIFNQNSNQFEGVCFIQNVREKLENRGGLVYVQKEILSKVLEDGDLKLDSLTIPPKIKERLNRLKVFIVLDDVDDSLKMETLVKGVDGLGQGSRIMIASRDKQVLRNCRVNDDNIYEVKGFNCHEALQLFCNYAFDENGHSEEPMVNRLVNFANGNPLALKVLGSSLYKKSKEEWESVVNKFEPTNLSREIFDVLKISYDGLKDIEKDIFLDIACFFKGRERDYVTIILNDCHYTLRVLIDKSLITISSNDMIEMHDLLEEMGRDIVNKESPNKIGKRSRLWRQEDVLCTLKNDYGTPAVRGIFLNMFEINKDIHLSPRAFKEMYNLRLLKFYNSPYSTYSKVNFSEGLSDLSDKLRSLIWYGYPLQALPSNFNPNNLVELDLSGSNLESLWEDCMPAPKLRWLNLSGCTRVTKIPNLSKSPLLESIDFHDCRSLLDFPLLAQHLKYLVELDLSGSRNLKRLWKHSMEAPKLRWLNLSGCTRVTEIQGLSKSPLLESINLKDCSSLLDFPQLAQHLKNLRYLHWSGCYSLRSFPSDIHFESLTSLDFSNCNNLTKFGSQISGNNITSLDLSGTAIKELPHFVAHLNGLIKLFLGGCENLETLPSGICNLTSLQRLDLSDCSRLEILPENLGNLKSLKHLSAKRAAIKDLPYSIAHLNGLIKLLLGGCENLETLPSGICNLTSLQGLDLSDCSRLEILPENLGNLKSLKHLSAKRAAIKELPHSIAHLNGLIKLFLGGCENLETLPSGIHFESLRSLDLRNCNNLTKFPQISGNNITSLDLSGTAIKELHHSISHLNVLEKLSLRRCKNLETLPSSIRKSTFLRHLDLSDCSRLEILPEELGYLESLRYLSVKRAAIKELPHSIAHLNGLEELFLGGCKNLETLPSGICNLTSLQHLDLSDCSRLEILPENLGNLKSLKFLLLDNCNMVVSLIDLPSNLRYLSACDCKQLQSIPNELVFARILKTKPTEFIFTNCMNLEETAVSNMLPRLVQHLHQGYIRFSFSYLGREVPKWFRYRNEGPSIKFQQPFDWKLKGLAVCAVIVFDKYLFNGDTQHKLGVHFDGTGSEGDQSSPTNINIMSMTAYVTSRNRTLIDSDHVTFGYVDASRSWRFRRQINNYSFEFRLSEESPNCRLKSCGVCPIYYQHFDTYYSDGAGTSGIRFYEEEMEQHSKEKENLQTVKYAEPIEHIGETSGSRFDEEDSYTDDCDEASTSGSRFDEEEMEPHPKENENLQTVKYTEPIEDIRGTSGSRFYEVEMEPHPKENENLLTVKYAEPTEHIGETSGIRRSRTSNDHLEEEVEPHPKRLYI